MLKRGEGTADSDKLRTEVDVNTLVPFGKVSGAVQYTLYGNRSWSMLKETGWS